MVSPVAPELVRPSTSASVSLVWRFDPPRLALGSAPVGGGWGPLAWVLNIGVPLDYSRTDLGQHSTEVAADAGVIGPGATLFTAVDVRLVQRAEEAALTVDATVGVTKPTWAADRDDAYTSWPPGTINTVVQMPVELDPGAAENAVMTITEAKTQALLDAGIPGTGTASDSVVICWPPDHQPVERFAGPRSLWGARLARTVYRAVSAGIEARG